jgi:uncharacterized protein
VKALAKELCVNPIWLIVIGVAVGIYSGIMGLGGGTIMIPILVLALGFGQHKAVATSLAVMIPPVTLPAVIRYWKDGHVDWQVAAWIAVGVLCGTPLGQMVAKHLSDTALKLVFGFVLVYIAGYTIFQTLGKQYRTTLRPPGNLPPKMAPLPPEFDTPHQAR